MDHKMTEDMFAKNRTMTPKRTRLRRSGERGGAIIELALTMPMLLVLVTAIYSFGVYFNTLMQLTDGVNIAGQQLAVERSNTLDPCNLAYTTLRNAAPYLNANNLSMFFILDGTRYPTSGTFTSGTVSCSSTSTSTGAPANLVQGQPITIFAFYPCSLALAGISLVPNCTMNAEITEIEQ
jgi:Flp pilus assembly protein TadG